MNLTYQPTRVNPLQAWAEIVAPNPLSLVTVAHIKDEGKIQYDTENQIIEDCILSAYEYVQQYLNRSILPRTLQAEFNGDLNDCFELPYTASEVIDKPENLTVKGVLRKSLTGYVSGLFTVEYVSGFTAAIPESIRRAIIKVTLDLFENRETGTTDPSQITKTSVHGLLRKYRVNIL